MQEPTVKTTLPNGREVNDNDPIMLRDAAALMFPDGSVGEKSLRRLRDRGQLDCSRIAGKDFTTLAAMRVMLERTRVQPRRPAVGGPPRLKAEANSKVEGQSALAAFMETAQSLLAPVTKPRGKQAKKPSEPPDKVKKRKRQLVPRVPKVVTTEQ